MTLTDRQVKSKSTPDDATATPKQLEAGFADKQWAGLQVAPLLDLQDNWDGYGADKPAPLPLVLAGLTLSILSAIGHAVAPDIMPLRDGGISLTWSGSDSSEMEIEYRTDAQIRFTTKTGDYNTVPLSAADEALEALIAFVSNEQPHVP